MKIITLLVVSFLSLSAVNGQRYNSEIIKGDTIIYGGLNPNKLAHKTIDSLNIIGVDTIVHYNFKDADYGWAGGSSVSYILWQKDKKQTLQIIDDVSLYQPVLSRQFSIPFDYCFQYINAINKEIPFEDSVYKNIYSPIEYEWTDSLGIIQKAMKMGRIEGEEERFQLEIYLGTLRISKKLDQFHFMSGPYLANYNLKSVILMRLIEEKSEQFLKKSYRILPQH